MIQNILQKKRKLADENVDFSDQNTAEVNYDSFDDSFDENGIKNYIANIIFYIADSTMIISSNRVEIILLFNPLSQDDRNQFCLNFEYSCGKLTRK